MPPPQAGNSVDYHPAPAGLHIARCYQIVDLGMQKGEWKGNETYQHKVYWRFELPNEKFTYEKDGEEIESVFSIGETLTYSLGDKARLRDRMKGWRGRDYTDDELQAFDIFNALNQNAMVNIVHKVSQSNGKTYANIASLSMPEKGRDLPPAINKALGFSLYQYSPEEFSNLPKWMRETINTQDLPEIYTVQRMMEEPAQTSAQEYAEAAAGGSADDFDDEIPF